MIYDPSELTVECDECGLTHEFDTTQYCDGTFGVDESTLSEEGWTEEGLMHYCRDCSEKRED